MTNAKAAANVLASLLSPLLLATGNESPLTAREVDERVAIVMDGVDEVDLDLADAVLLFSWLREARRTPDALADWLEENLRRA